MGDDKEYTYSMSLTCATISASMDTAVSGDGIVVVVIVSFRG